MNGVQGVEGSNPFIPTRKFRAYDENRKPFSVWNQILSSRALFCFAVHKGTECVLHMHMTRRWFVSFGIAFSMSLQARGASCCPKRLCIALSCQPAKRRLLFLRALAFQNIPEYTFRIFMSNFFQSIIRVSTPLQNFKQRRDVSPIKQTFYFCDMPFWFRS